MLSWNLQKKSKELAKHKTEENIRAEAYIAEHNQPTKKKRKHWTRWFPNYWLNFESMMQKSRHKLISNGTFNMPHYHGSHWTMSKTHFGRSFFLYWWCWSLPFIYIFDPAYGFFEPGGLGSLSFFPCVYSILYLSCSKGRKVEIRIISFNYVAYCWRERFY